MENKENGKIGILIGQLSQVGGVGITAIEEVKNLRKLGYAAELLVLKEQPKFHGNFDVTEIPIRYLSREIPWPFNRSFKLPFFSFFSLFHLTYPFLAPLTIKTGEYDCLIVHETYNAFTALTLKWFRRIPFYPFVWDPISYIMPRIYTHRFLRRFFFFLLPIGRFLDVLIMREAKVTLLGSSFHLALLKKIYPPGRFAVVYSGCYPQISIPEKRGDFILALTKWDSGKNPSFLLEIMKKLKDTNTRLVLGGNWAQSSLRDGFQRRVREEGLAERVELTGLIDDRMKDKLLSEARLLVHPIVEAFGMFGLEAAGCGCPIIIPKGSGVSELFEEGISGFFPAEGDTEGFTEKVDQFLADERKAWAMGQAAWAVAKKNTWEIHTGRLLEVIEK